MRGPVPQRGTGPLSRTCWCTVRWWDHGRGSLWPRSWRVATFRWRCPGRSWAAGAPEELVTALRDLVGADGLLPPWHTWFGPEALAELVPDPTLRAHVIADVPRVPLAYLEAVAPTHSGWERVPCGYLRLSDAYVDEEAEAQRRGWSTARLDRHHLSAVTDPQVVAEAVLDLARRRLTR